MARQRPLFVQRIRERHPDKAVEVWFQERRPCLRDEARIGQQGTLTNVWAERGSRPAAVRQTEYEWCYLFAAVNPLTGASSAIVAPTVHTKLMDQHLRFISETVGAEKHVVLVLDRAGWHVANDLKVPRNITLLHLPSYSPELNPIERIWAYLRSHYLSNRIYTDYDHLFDETSAAWNLLDEERLKSITATSWLTHEVQS